MTLANLDVVNAMRLSLDASPAVQAAEALALLLPELVERAEHVVPRLVELLHVPAKLFIFERDDLVAPDTREARFVLKPSHGLLVVLAAARAGNVDLSIIEQAFGHDPSPSVAAAPMVGSGPAAEQSAPVRDPRNSTGAAA